MAKSNFTYTIDGKILFIQDSNEGGMSVTNDIEMVLHEMNELLKEMNTSLKEFDVIYRDSQGMIDGVYTKDDRYYDFYYIGESDYINAKNKIKHLTNESNNNSSSSGE
jgi:hypothetical protein